MASKTTLNAKNLEVLGAERLAELLIEIATGSAAAKRRLRLELAGTQSGAEVARAVMTRLSSIERARTKITWRRIKAMKKDLEIQRLAIVDVVAPIDADEALAVMWRFLGLARSIFSRCDDSNGTLLAVFREALADLGRIAEQAHGNRRDLAERCLAALQDNAHGQYDGLIKMLTPALGPEGLTQLKALLREWLQQDDGTPHRRRDIIIRLALEQIADAEGDVDGYIAQQSDAARAMPPVAADIACRLLSAGRATEALAALDAAVSSRHFPMPFAWEEARVEALEMLGRKQEAQDFRWQRFETGLSVAHLRAHLKRLPDFDDMEAEDKALAHALTFPDASAALEFLIAWPSLARASKLVIARHREIDGDDYALLTPAAEALSEMFPLAATLLLRSMIDFALDHARASRYPHAGRHLAECAAMAPHIEDFGKIPSHASYVADLALRHAKKRGFWTAAG